jgi:AraC family transcriptional regulator
VRTERFGLTRLAFFRHVGPYDEVGEAWRKLYAWAGRNGLLGPSAETLGVVHDDPEITPPERLRYDAALAVNERVRPEGEAGSQELEPAEYAVALHRGPYNTLNDTYSRLCGEWLPASGREARSAPAFEIYRNSPYNTPAGQLIIEIYISLMD